MQLDLLPYARRAACRPAGDGQEIRCRVRKTWLVATPEEFVRQGMIELLAERGYPISLMQVERAVGRSRDRLDLLVLDREARPFVLAEAKAPGFDLRPAVRQLARYNRHWRAPYVLAVNGSDAHLYAIDFAAERLPPLRALPAYPG